MSYYVVFAPLQQIQDEANMNGALLRVWMISPVGYQELTTAEGILNTDQSVWLEGVDVGLKLWEGTFEEDVPRLWLRWCDLNGQVIPTGAEGQGIERQRADRLAERLRAMGTNPDEI
ncbi:MAG: hypothetical protein AAF572_09865 [Cyanobacteria bacterium P01_B01_bin.77]